MSVLTGHEAHDARGEMRPEVDIKCGLHALRQVRRICLHSFGPGGTEIVEEVAFNGDAFVIDLDRQAGEAGMLCQPCGDFAHGLALGDDVERDAGDGGQVAFKLIADFFAFVFGFDGAVEQEVDVAAYARREFIGEVRAIG